ncbi:serine-threonine protein kinase [Streptomyces sp. NPDC005423]|uniref:serine-threonine protein kinase n=1 Tax=Streptomyces sp. NPDC005423 TaxID=3155343 RepID=UPI0033B35FED
MAEQSMSVRPYWELTFDAEGNVDRGERERLFAGVAREGVRDLLVFAHGWNADRATATRLYDRFFAPLPALAPGAALGYVGVVWPSMRFPDEPVPDFTPSATAAPSARPALDTGTRHALLETFPGRAEVLDRMGHLLDERPRQRAELARFGELVRQFVEVGPREPFAADLSAEGEPWMFSAPPETVCDELARALDGLASPGGTPGFSLPDPWDGARELLRQAAYFAIKRRAGTVGEHGLGLALGQLALSAPRLRVHLVGHSFGARLVAFALAGLPEGVRPVKSVTLLQGAFSHYAFAACLPEEPGTGGVLRGRQNRIDGPLVCCYSHFDSALGTIYPLVSCLSDDCRSLAGSGLGGLLGPKWGALGHDGVRGVPGTVEVTLAEALATRLPDSGCVNVDAASVVRRGGAPAGAHSDILHPELARVVLAAGRIARPAAAPTSPV